MVSCKDLCEACIGILLPQLGIGYQQFPILRNATVAVGLSVIVELHGNGAVGAVSTAEVLTVTGAVEGRDDLHVVFCRCHHDLVDLRGTEVLLLILIVMIDLLDPASHVTATEPGEIVAVHIGLVILRIPDIEASTLILGEAKLHGIVAHKGTLADEIADPILGIILSATVQHDHTLGTVRLICQCASGQTHAVVTAEHLDDHEAAVHETSLASRGDADAVLGHMELIGLLPQLFGGKL